jgi:hypothetical protein
MIGVQPWGERTCALSTAAKVTHRAARLCRDTRATRGAAAIVRP